MDQRPSSKDLLSASGESGAVTNAKRNAVMVALAAIAVAAWVGYLSLRALWHLFVGLPPGVAPAIITGCATILTATCTVMAARHFERRKELAVLHREKKTQMYDLFLKNLFTVIGVQTGPPDPAVVGLDQPHFLNEWQRTLILWAGPETVSAYCVWKAKLVTAPHSIDTLLALERLLLAIREDIGHSNGGLETGQLTAMFLRNAEQIIAVAKANPAMTLLEAEQLLKAIAAKNPGAETPKN